MYLFKRGSGLIVCFLLYSIAFSFAQENYEIQVYSSEITKKGETVVELHSNFTFEGEKDTINGVLPSNHIFHETVEITHGFSNWFEVGFYIFSAFGDNNRSSYVGSHIRPRISVPEKWEFPIGLSLSAEVGYQQLQYSEDDWTLEIRPIIDKKINNLYLSFNPTIDKSLNGLNKNNGFNFSPNFKIDFEILKTIAPGIEYYGSFGSFNHFELLQQQQHNVFISFDFLALKNWELNIGYGVGLTTSTDNSIVKFILGRKF